MHRILIIDDNEAIHADFCKILCPGGESASLQSAKSALFGDEPAPKAPVLTFEVTSALQGQAGLETLRTSLQEGRPFAVAFVDMRMPPGWDGLETIQQLWKVDPEIQIVICSAYSDHSWADISATLGLTDRLLILKKPFDPLEVTQIATAMAEKWRLRKQASLKLEELERLVQARTDALSHAALHDLLTGLPNRALLCETLQKTVDQSRRVGDWYGVYFMDFDRFKVVNDTLGHRAGDELLMEIAARLRGFTPPPGVTLTTCRLGGDEFVVLATSPTRQDSLAIGDSLLHRLSVPYRIDGFHLTTTASIGITTSDLAYAQSDDAIRDADTAMYRAKAAGKGRCQMFDLAMHKELTDRMAVETALTEVVKRGELVLHYQPVYDLNTGSLRGFEALVRWLHPERGLVPPAQFIKIAEESGAILFIGEWVLGEACRQLRDWRASHPDAGDFMMTVNVSAKQLRDPSIITQVERALERYSIPPHCLVLEVTESAVIEDPTFAHEVLGSIRDLGVKIYLDDFGTGYTSFSYLHRLPLQGLKIDRGFIKTLTDRRDYAAVVHAIVCLAHNLGICVVAEGIEVPEQVSMLQSLECDFAQGYHFGKPMPAADCVKLLSAPPQRLAA